MKKKLFLILTLILVFTMAAFAGGASETSEAPSTPATDERTESTPSGDALRALVVYFSATGNTEAVANEIASQTGADIYEIVPEVPYTSQDLNYSDRTTRATVEQNTPDSRPAISGTVENINQYDVIFIGYPIWWGDIPRIICTFLDTYDLSGKTIAPFCTSGGSGLSRSVTSIRNLEPNANVVSGLSIGSSRSRNASNNVSSWLSELGLAQ